MDMFLWTWLNKTCFQVDYIVFFSWSKHPCMWWAELLTVLDLNWYFLYILQKYKWMFCLILVFVWDWWMQSKPIQAGQWLLTKCDLGLKTWSKYICMSMCWYHVYILAKVKLCPWQLCWCCCGLFCQLLWVILPVVVRTVWSVITSNMNRPLALGSAEMIISVSGLLVANI